MESAANFDGENRKPLILYKKKGVLIRNSENKHAFIQNNALQITLGKNWENIHRQNSILSRKTLHFWYKIDKNRTHKRKRLFRQPFLYTFLLCAEATCNDQCTVLSLSLSAACPVYRNIHRVFSLIPDSRNRLNITANHLMIENQQRQQIDSSCISVATFHSIS